MNSLTRNNTKSEKQIQNEIRVALSENGCTCFRANVGLFFTKQGVPVSTGLPKGFPDLFGFRNSDGKFFAIEVKNEKGRLRKEQVTFGKFAESQLILYGVARSAEEAVQIISKKGWCE